MYSNFLKFLVDPKTKEPLNLNITKKDGENILEGTLSSSSSIYPIVRGIPRFLDKEDKNDNKSFSYQWNKWPKIQFESENKGKIMEGHTLKMWERITGVKEINLTDKLMIDFGCGSGRFIEIARMKGARVIGLDISDSVEASGRIFQKDPNVLICQGDILKPPLKTEIADGIFSIGTLHHTTDPKKGFEEMVKILKQGGWIATSVYTTGIYNDPIVNIYRSFFKKCWPFLGHYPPLIYTYLTTYLIRPLFFNQPTKIFAHILKIFFPLIHLPDIKWSLLDTFDCITPTHQSCHTLFELFQWFKNCNLERIEPSDWGGASLHALKSNE
ncbi:MAG: hypothetical protein A3I11_04230 [Elusimicrobia bacterium RIFCSPLOWO2_02_FULL_39_32]|nr:MAG: hypothetical protein A3B80_02805 [Elusimicrobia bacterium RIFCSPHIGHO2_02_FULL_39_36]OGR92907.1 MAG: hypothetical protein A3I11_04230 [Elusimicrobia bacterium RIFCSPLOWO2_02_FULL_39_32]OGR99691.1 MAG: hypothetical protein A3G85_01595 [Elusimicrobia bacterium RIFCSPLOWO2_12_FULL_39_28]